MGLTIVDFTVTSKTFGGFWEGCFIALQRHFMVTFLHFSYSFCNLHFAFVKKTFNLCVCVTGPPPNLSFEPLFKWARVCLFIVRIDVIRMVNINLALV